ncbi:Hym1p [Sorochytrium milnesiophthora]
MSFLFKAKAKTPQDLVRSVRDGIVKLDTSDRKSDKAGEELSKNLNAMKHMLIGDGEHDPDPHIVSTIAQEVYNTDLMSLLVNQLSRFEFESKKDVTLIMNSLLRRQYADRYPTVEHLCAKPDILIKLVKGYESPDVALNCGMMLRESIRYEALAKILLNDPSFWNFFKYVDVSTFDLASDAFATMKELLTKHKAIVAEFLEANYAEFFDVQFLGLLNSTNYVTKRQSLKLLGELLLDRVNFNVMTRYIANAENLKLMMNLLRDKSRNIQYEAFHVFKVFVANPNKVKPVADILQKNKEKLVSYLSSFHNDRTDDEQFNEEKQFLIRQISEL